MIKQYRLSSLLFIFLICYIPILGIFIPKTQFGAGIPDFDATRVVLLLLILLFFIETAMLQKIRGYTHWIIVVIFYGFIVSISPLWSTVYEYDTRLIQELFNYSVSPVIVLVIALSVFKGQKNIEQYIKHLMIAVTILSVISIIQIGMDLSRIHDEPRAIATLSNPNLLAIYLVLSIPCILHGIEHELVSKKLGALVVILVICGVVATVSKKGAGGMLVCFFLYFLLKKQYKKIFAFVLLVFISGVLLSGYSIVENRFSFEQFEKQIKGKWAMTSAGVQMFSEKPVLGQGYKGYYEKYGEYFPNKWRKKYDAHNEFITALANYGIFGLILFLGIFLYPLNYARKIIKKANYKPVSAFKKSMAVIAVSTIVPFMLSASAAGALFYQQIAVFTFYTHVSFSFTDDAS